MRVIRCHVDAALAAGQALVLAEDKSQHLLRVLRLREGDRVQLFNGDGANYPARIAVAAKKAVELAIEGREEFLEAGGEDYAVLDCLNTSVDGLAMIETMLRRELSGWI